MFDSSVLKYIIFIFGQAAGAFDGYGEECEGKDVCIGPIIKV